MQIKLLCERQLNAKWTKNSWKLFITRTKIKNTPRALGHRQKPSLYFYPHILQCGILSAEDKKEDARLTRLFIFVSLFLNSEFLLVVSFFKF
jgi:hypothetical protein